MALSSFVNTLEAQQPAPIPKVIDHYARVFQIEPGALYELMECESGGNPKSFNPADPNGGSYGLYQYQKKTWDLFAKEARVENPDIWNPHDQILVTAYAFSRGRQNHWWNCTNAKTATL